MERPPAVNFLVGLGIFTAVAVGLYWAAWFGSPDLVQSRTPADADYVAYVTFEEAFPLADAWLALCALIGAVGLHRMRPWGFLFMLLAGSAAMFLGFMDLLYDLEHGIFATLTPESTIELIIVTITLALGPVVIYLTWKQRALLLR
jgi:uncharacterized membrane protein (DUF2068 family)